MNVNGVPRGFTKNALACQQHRSLFFMLSFSFLMGMCFCCLFAILTHCSAGRVPCRQHIIVKLISDSDFDSFDLFYRSYTYLLHIYMHMYAACVHTNSYCVSMCALSMIIPLCLRHILCALTPRSARTHLPCYRDNVCVELQQCN